MVKAMVGGCCVCSDERGWDENPLVYCDGHGCNVAVHQACYGIVQVPKGPWFCRKCESQERIARVKCELCPSKNGALKRTDSGGWAHVVCALYIPEVRFGNVTTMEPIILASVPHERYLKMCYICEERGKESKTAHGGCMNCNKQGCRQTFHVTCAQSCGLLCEENDGQSGPTVKYVGYCQFHWNKRSKGLLDLTKGNDKDKMRLKVDKDKEKKQKPRTNSESASTSIIPTKPDITCSNSTPVTDSPSPSPSSSLSNTTIPGMPKPRGRKPSTVVKSLPTNTTTPNDSSPKTPNTSQVKESPLNSPLPKSGPTPMEVETTVAITKSLDVTTVTTTSVVSPVQKCKNVLSSSKSVAQPTPTPPPVSIPTPPAKPAGRPSSSAEKPSAAKPPAAAKPPSAGKTPSGGKPPIAGKPPASVKASSGEVKQPPKKRPSSKSTEEPKRKVGRPLKHPKPRPSASKPSKPRSQNRSKDTSNNSIRPTESNHYSGFNSMSSPVSIYNSVPSTHGSYVIPQPRLAGQLENGHRATDSKQTNGPLQLPNTLEQLLEYQWEQGAQYIMQQASQFDVASLMSSLHQLKADNSRLENRLESLLARRSQLIQVNTRLSAPMSCTPTSTSTTTTDTTNKQPNKVTSCTAITAQTDKTVSLTQTTTSVTNVQTVKSPNQAPKVSATSYSPSTLPTNNMNTNMKGKSDVAKLSSAKVAIPAPIAIGTVATTTGKTAAVPRMVTPNTIGMQPSQIKITMVQPHASNLVEKDKQKVAILPSVTLQSTIPSQFLTGQQLQVLQSKTSQSSQGKGTKQPVLLPHQAVTSQTFTTQHIPQHQLLLLMQQQQRQHHLNDQRLITNQSQLSSVQIKSGATSGHSQNFVPSAMQLGFPSSFLTLGDGHIDASKAAAFATLPTLVQLDKPKGLDLDKNGTALPGEKNIKKS